MKKAILLKPLDGKHIGAEVEFSDADFERLKERGAVREAKSAPAPENKKAQEPANKGKK